MNCRNDNDYPPVGVFKRPIKNHPLIERSSTKENQCMKSFLAMNGKIMSGLDTSKHGRSIANTFLSLCCVAEIWRYYRPIEKLNPFLDLKINICIHYLLCFLK